MDYKAALKELKANHLANTDSLRNEEDTKRVLVVPFFEALGYDTRNPVEFSSEVSAPGGGRVDYAILHDGNPVIIIECKPVSRGHLIDDRGQLRRYFNAAKPDVAILTNGIQYQFFSDLDNEGVMDSEPFLEADLGECDDDDFGEPGAPIINALSAFTKAKFSSDGVREAATVLKYKSGIRRFLEQQFGDNDLHTDFIELLGRQVYSRNFTPRIREQMGVLSREVIGEFKDAIFKEATKNPDHTTTKDEAEGYYIVKNVLWNVVDSDRVVMRDASTYCSIRLDNDNRNGRTICRLRFNNLNRKKIGLFDKGPEEQVPIANLGEINNYAERIRQAARQILERER